MANLITVENGVALLDPATANRVEYFERTLKEFKAAEEDLKKRILAEMEEKNILSLKTRSMTISYVAATDKETFDSKKLREEMPEVFDEYVKMSPVKASVRIRVYDL